MTDANTTSLPIFNAIFWAFLLGFPWDSSRKIHSIENRDDSCVYVVWFGGWVKRLKFFFLR